MDPNTRGAEENGYDDGGTSRSSEFETGGGDPPRQRPPRDSLTTDFGQHAPALARTAQLVAGDFLLTVNPVDGSEIELCPPGERPGRPQKLTSAQRAEVERAAAPPVLPGPSRPDLPLLGRQDERERLVRLLARGRSVRLTGPGGSGRTRLLGMVAEDCEDLAPDGVVRLSGFHRGVNDLLHDLFYAVHSAPLYRPEPDELLELVGQIGAVVVLDDIEFGGAALDELLTATPECAFLISATPDVPAPSADASMEEVFLDGLDRAGGLDLLEQAVGRSLTEEESNWAGDLWFESEGLPLRFVQAGALLRQRDRLRAGVDAFDEFGVFQELPADSALDALPGASEAEEVPLPSLAEGAAPAALLASRLSASARAALRFAVALGGEVPHQAHLPALVGDTHADAALGELLSCALVSPVGSRYRLAAGVQTQLEAAGYADDTEEQVLTAARHYAWWAGHPSVTPERVCAEADALLTALGVLVPATTPPAEGEESATVQLARTAAPAFAAGLHWSAWERALRFGAEAARLSGDVTEQAYFHHELGVLALCEDRPDRARAELEASIGLRGAVADKRGTVAGRRALALVADRSGTTPDSASAPVLGATPALGSAAGEEMSHARHEESASPPGGVPAASAQFPPLQRPSDTSTLVTHRSTPGAAPHRDRGGLRGLAKRNLVATGAGALLVAVLGTVVTLGATSSNDADSPSQQVGVNPSASQGAGKDGLGADPANQDGDTGEATSRPTDPGPDGTLGTSDDPTPTATGSGADEPSDDPSGTRDPGDDSPTSSPTKSPSKPPTSPKPPTDPTDPPSETSDPPTETSEPPTETSEPPEPTDTAPSTTDSASGPVETTSSAGAPETSEAGSPSTSQPVI
ncbi:ATP-binding protein [Streptomyces cadmiisoli]|uniref:ATP-binding protein n=1 Tax=Streptomyces cadmiisoli TaxID=2184053 RepID=A0A2Z4IXA7_9ACTN|nr:ATP-binding protein [Streptomyces cadmiisoli]AWW37505.1 ATP-binding protein [Streptomyces cadmiisoli]